ncbi:hypothetical protein MMC09_005955 [Bachmanniomyces sp. S44760]|nr:hypothetical protein [Bachmanniomyces sp. S44760]
MKAYVALLVIPLLANFAAAQSTSNSTIDPNSVPLTERNSWCNGEVNTCGMLCGGKTVANNCSGSDLTYTCTCMSNNSAPGLAFYMGTLPTFICNTQFGACIAAHPNDLAGQQQCNQTYVCGNLNASSVPVATSTSSSSSSMSATASPTTSPSASASAKSNMALKVGQDYGMGLFAAGALAVLGLAL